MKKTLLLVIMLVCFGLFTNPASVRAFFTVDAPPLVYLETAPEFIYPVELGFGVAIGIPYDMYFISGAYYLYKDKAWYIGSSYEGPWTLTGYRTLPPPLRKYKLANIRAFRDRDYLHFHEKREGYKGKSFRPEKPAPREEPRGMKY